MNYVNNFEKILSGRKKVFLRNHVYNFFENLPSQNFFKIGYIVHCTIKNVFSKLKMGVAKLIFKLNWFKP